jgi:hypothetical protein
MDPLIQQAISAIASGSVAAAVIGIIFHRRTKAIEQELRVQAEALLVITKSTRQWHEESLSRVLGPVAMHLMRTKRAFERWNSQQLFMEIEVIGNSNRTIRDLLLANGHLIPGELLDHASRLVEHYDAWLEEFEEKRRSEKPDLRATFVFAGPKGYPFPRDAERAFIEKFEGLRSELYDQPSWASQ